jgi:hypothetical protein
MGGILAASPALGLRASDDDDDEEEEDLRLDPVSGVRRGTLRHTYICLEAWRLVFVPCYRIPCYFVLKLLQAAGLRGLAPSL